MTEMFVDCPHCEGAIKLPPKPERLIGTAQECPHCGKRGIFQLDDTGHLHFFGMVRQKQTSSE